MDNRGRRGGSWGRPRRWPGRWHRARPGGGPALGSHDRGMGRPWTATRITAGPPAGRGGVPGPAGAGGGGRRCGGGSGPGRRQGRGAAVGRVVGRFAVATETTGAPSGRLTAPGDGRGPW